MLGVVLGYSASKEKGYKERLRNGVIHYDTYKHMTNREIQEEIERLVSPEHKIGLTTHTTWKEMGILITTNGSIRNGISHRRTAFFLS
ncbi:hypothetical protein H0486_12490 [Lachnospiraceae bacterium MD1]|jgi:N-acetyl-gamma-glutamylphosphate reductase|uniref:Uncharacterized protein n=1 Tax=Variimorphobacter saccharofermentans TaxID=2755051 RepID=A0A839K1B3_9FIRM|nr:hypothetical protein [Variimorphobacter saccharofermentans]MBB2183693.1 hypothetical protein [Variimorphobacter saccharofermentans]